MKRVGRIVGRVILAINMGLAICFILIAYSSYVHPAAHPLVSCVGLTFPFFLALTLCFFIFWLFVNYRYALVSLIALLICFPQIRTYVPIHSVTDVPAGSLKVLSYNVMGFNGLKKVKGQNEILNYLVQSGADVICLQEYAETKDRKYLTRKEILSALKAYRYRRIQSVGGKGGGNQMACFSKYPILSADKVDYESDYNGSMVYKLKIGDDTLMLINNHLESNKLTKEDKVIYEEMLNKPEAKKVKSGLKHLVRKLAEASVIRSKQAEAVAEVVEQSTYPSVIVCGDFNDASISYTHRIMRKGLDDAFTESGRGLGISYNQNKFYFRIDNILISTNLETFNCTVDRSIKESDHYPIWCYVKKR